MHIHIYINRYIYIHTCYFRDFDMYLYTKEIPFITKVFVYVQYHTIRARSHLASQTFRYHRAPSQRQLAGRLAVNPAAVLWIKAWVGCQGRRTESRYGAARCRSEPLTGY